ncbi:hypothetical protein MRB53_010854 [Persea americana]|uniref:Uncharacterized protein n=1 Tax=Persea americana TaxID=3435 RepID=A0ACC2LTY1_PERAE|nr:hypothetical protein MRB53_010854 [Persea americana]
MEAQKIRLKAARFWLSPDGRLYRKSFTGPYLQCVHPSKVTTSFTKFMRGSAAATSEVGRLPTEQSAKDTGGRTCRRTPKSMTENAKIARSSHTLSTSQWGLDIVGPLHRTPRNKRWLIVATDYFTNFCQEYGIRNVYSTPAYPQSNGQAEISNKVILEGLKKRLDRAKGRWAKELPSVLWAYKTTPRRSTSATPFSLAYGMEAVIPLEVGLPTLTLELCDQRRNDSNVARELDFAEERRKTAAISLAAYQQQLAREYNQKVRPRRFAVEELVLKKTLPGDRNPNEGKLAPNWQGPYKVLSTAGRATYRLKDMEGKELPRPWNTMHLKNSVAMPASFGSGDSTTPRLGSSVQSANRPQLALFRVPTVLSSVPAPALAAQPQASQGPVTAPPPRLGSSVQSANRPQLGACTSFGGTAISISGSGDSTTPDSAAQSECQPS